MVRVPDNLAAVPLHAAEKRSLNLEVSSFKSQQFGRISAVSDLSLAIRSMTAD
jgi:hypothetical protein